MVQDFDQILFSCNYFESRYMSLPYVTDRWTDGPQSLTNELKPCMLLWFKYNLFALIKLCLSWIGFPVMRSGQESQLHPLPAIMLVSFANLRSFISLASCLTEGRAPFSSAHCQACFNLQGNGNQVDPHSLANQNMNGNGTGIECSTFCSAVKVTPT